MAAAPAGPSAPRSGADGPAQTRTSHTLRKGKRDAGSGATQTLALLIKDSGRQLWKTYAKLHRRIISAAGTGKRGGGEKGRGEARRKDGWIDGFGC